MALQIEQRERRVAQRRAVREVVRFRTTAGTIHIGVAANLSRTGAFIRTEHVPPLGARIELEMGSRDDGFAVPAAVVRVLAVPFNETTPTHTTGIGVRFL